MARKIDISKSLGALPSAWDYRTYRVLSPTRLQVEVLPTEYKGLLEFTPDGPSGNPNKVHPDQGNVGSCVGWDGSIVMEIANNINDKGFEDMSAWWAYGRSRAYSTPPIINWQDEGSTNFGLLKALNKEGCVKEEICPTPITNQPFECYTEENVTKAAEHAIDQYWNINPQPNDVKAAMYGITHELPYKMPDGSPGKTAIISAFPVYENFYEANNNGGIVPLPKWGEQLLGGHSSALVTWELKDGKEYYGNYGSWGEDVGNGGLFYIPTNYPFYPNDFFLIHNGPPTNNPNPDPTPTPSPCNNGNGTAKILNVAPWLLRRKGRFYYLNP